MQTIVAKLNEFISASKMEGDTPQFTYLVGVNGTGKTRVLNNLARSQLNANRVSSVACITNVVFDKFTYSAGRKALRYEGLRNVGNAIFLSAIPRNITMYLLEGIATKANFLKRITDSIKVDFVLQFGPFVEKSDVDALLSLIDRRRLGRKKIENYFTEDEIVQIRGLISRPLPFSKITKKNAILLGRFIQLYPVLTLHINREGRDIARFEELGSGEQNRILLAVKIAVCKAERALILIDEPEVSLHLQWQMELPTMLQMLTSEIKKIHIVIATHSPVIISEAAKLIGKTRIIELSPPPLSPPAKNKRDVILFRVLPEHELENFDSILLDCFKTNPHNSEIINKEVANITLEIAERGSASLIEIHRLQALKSVTGATAEHTVLIDKAINILKRNFTNEIAADA